MENLRIGLDLYDSVVLTVVLWYVGWTWWSQRRQTNTRVDQTRPPESEGDAFEPWHVSDEEQAQHEQQLLRQSQRRATERQR